MSNYSNNSTTEKRFSLEALKTKLINTLAIIGASLMTSAVLLNLHMFCLALSSAPDCTFWIWFANIFGFKHLPFEMIILITSVELTACVLLIILGFNHRFVGFKRKLMLWVCPVLTVLLTLCNGYIYYVARKVTESY